MGPAPINERKLRACLAPFPTEARILPGEAYTSPEVFEWERKHFFEDGWVCVSRSDELARPGDQRALRIGDEGVLLVRNENGALTCFLERMPAPGSRARHVRRRTDQPRRRAVSLPPVDVRPGRVVQRGTGSRRAGGLRSERPRPLPPLSRGRGVGAAGSSSTSPAAPRRSTITSAVSTNWRARTSPSVSSRPHPIGTRSTPTGS